MHAVLCCAAQVCIVTDDYLLKDLAVGGESEDAGQKVMFATSCATLIRVRCTLCALQCVASQ